MLGSTGLDVPLTHLFAISSLKWMHTQYAVRAEPNRANHCWEKQIKSPLNLMPTLGVMFRLCAGHRYGPNLLENRCKIDVCCSTYYSCENFESRILLVVSPFAAQWNWDLLWRTSVESAKMAVAVGAITVLYCCCWLVPPVTRHLSHGTHLLSCSTCILSCALYCATGFLSAATVEDGGGWVGHVLYRDDHTELK